MNEELKYKIALGTARKLYENGSPDVRSSLDTIFPELKEELGEKIRSALIDHFESIKGVAWKEFQISDVLEWLKGQDRKSLMEGLQVANKKIGELVEENYYLKESVWTKEDEENLTYILAALDAYSQLRKERDNTSAQEKLDAAREWLNGRLKSIKPKPWTYEDEARLNDIIEDSEQHCLLGLDQIEWLKDTKKKLFE